MLLSGLLDSAHFSSYVLDVLLRAEYLEHLFFVIVYVTLHDLHARTQKSFESFNI